MNESKFDPTKPTITKSGLKAEFLCKLKNKRYPLVFKITHNDTDSTEEIVFYDLNGKNGCDTYGKKCCDTYDLTNKNEFMQVGGVYRARDGSIVVCSMIDVFANYPAVCFQIGDDNSEEYLMDGCYFFNKEYSTDDLLEYLFNIIDVINEKKITYKGK